MTQAPAEPAPDTTIPVGDDDSVVGFSVTEVGLLIRGAQDDPNDQGEQSDRAFEALQLSKDYFSDEIVGFGLSSLVARGWAAVIDEGDIQLSGPAQLLGYCLKEARRWTQIAFIAEDGGDIAVYLQAPESSVLLQPRGAGTWFAIFRTPEARDSALIRLALESAAALAPGSLAYFDSTTETDGARFFVRKTGDDQWTYAIAPAEGPIPDSPADEDVPLEEVDTDALLDALDELVKLPPAPSSATGSATDETETPGS